MRRLKNAKECREVTNKHLDYFTFDADDWFSCERNFAFIQGANIGFGEWKKPGVYWVHFCFDEAKGRQAIELTKQMFKELCKATDLQIAIGLIHVDNKKAKWLIRQVGFKSLGEVMTENGMCEMFYSTREINNGLV